jgi:hypothetical protein
MAEQLGRPSPSPLVRTLVAELTDD